MKKHNVFLLFTSLTALLFCACSSELKEKENASSKPGTVTLSIANDTQRTISPAAGISYKDVREWTVTFKDITESRSEKYNDIVKTVSFSERANQQIQLPLGTYAVIFKGDVIKQVTTGDETSEASTEPQTVPFYGESTVTVEDGKSASVSVFVAPKKTTGGTGSFNYIVNIDGIQDCPPSTATETQRNYFAAKLIPYNTGNEIELNCSVNPQQDNENIYTLTVTNNSVKSGFYKLSIKYIWETYDSEKNQITKDKEIFYPYHDFLVEIVDGLPTNGSVDITVSLEDSKTYYATTGETKGNGAFESLPKNLDELLDDIKDPTISTANIIVVDEIDPQNPSYPEIDVSKVNEAGKTYKIFTSSDVETILCYTITGAGEGGNPTIVIENQSIWKATLKNGMANIVTSSGRLAFELKNNASIFIDLTDSQETMDTTIYMPDSTYNTYYADHPCVTVKNDAGSQTEFYVNVRDDALNNSCIVVSNSLSDENYKTTNFYIIPSATASLGVTRDGVDVTESTLLYAGDTVKITATPAEGGAFAQDTTFAWFVNDKQVKCTEESYEITFGQDNVGVTNSILCLAGYNGGYATAGIELYAAEQTALLYTKYGLGYAKLADLNETTQVTEVLNFDSYPISDFCIDTKTNDAYLIYTDGATTLIKKATYNHKSTEHYAAADYTSNDAAPGLIKMGNDNNLYVRLDGEVQEGNLLGIVTLSSDDNGKAKFSRISIPLESTESTEILSFCVDSNGIVYTTYKSGKNIILASFENKDNSLQKRNSKILATINDTVESNYLPENISSNITITDMHYEDGYIYLIVRDVFIDYSTPTNSVRSLGGVCKIKAEDLTLADSTNPLIGWADTQLVITENESREKVYNYKHNEETQKYFYGPQKIIAIKPKEIVIADDGASIENSKMHQENRVVLFNLETNSITGVKTSPKEFYFSTSGGDTMNYKPN